MNEIKDKNSELFLFYVLMIATIVLIHEFITLNQHFFNQTFNLSVIIYPFTFFIVDFITKEHGKKKALFLIIFTAIFWSIYYTTESLFLTGYSFQKEFIITNILVFIVSQIINLIIYSKLLNNNKLNVINLITLFITIISFDTLLKIITSNELNNFILVLPNYLFNNLLSVLIAIITILSYFHLFKKV